jgi:RNA polymerase subunit RPABC4/transcription elongation factor Spt4
MAKPIQNKYTNLNFSRLASDRKLASLKIDILIKRDFSIREYVDWDLNDEKRTPKLFVDNILKQLNDIIEPNLIEYNKVSIKNQILDQLLEHVDKNTFFPRLKLIKKEGETSNSPMCPNCNTLINNTDICANCMFIFEKKADKKILVTKEQNNIEKPEDLRQTERQRILELRQKNINVNDMAVSYTQDGKEKKSCKKCGEINTHSSNECRSCKFKFPLVNYFDLNLNQNYSVHFWDKVNKNSTVQQLKNFQEFFSQEDFTSLKYLYEKTKIVLNNEFEDILTEEAFNELKIFLDKTYFSFSNPTHTVNLY